ncbi:MAG: hypothetical protein AAB293_03910 [Pseudomonadota bacterium]
MNRDPRRIIIHRILSNNTHDSGTNTTGRTPIFSANHWITYALLIPVVIVMTMVGFFFFAAFLALLAVAATFIGARFWWLRRRYNQFNRSKEHADEDWSDAASSAHSKQSSMIEDAQIIEEIKINSSSRNNHR